MKAIPALSSTTQLMDFIGLGGEITTLTLTNSTLTAYFTLMSLSS
jgi:hypothetical protein